MHAPAILCLLVLAASIAAAAAPGAGRATRHGLDFRTPASTWDEALPLGNGLLGALVWGDGQPLRISLDRSDLWDLRLVPEFQSEEYRFSLLRQWKEAGRLQDIRRLYEEPYRRPAPTRIPAGRIEVMVNGAGAFRDTRLTLAEPEASMRWADGSAAAVFVHAVEPAGMLRFTGRAAPAFRLAPPPFSGTVKNPAQGSIAAGDLAQLGYPAPVTRAGEHWQGYEQEGAEGFRFAVYLTWRKEGDAWEAAWSIASSFDGPDPYARARRQAEGSLARGYAGMFASHRDWWDRFWNQSSVEVPHPAVERQWYLDTYKFGAAARRGAPPITLQAVWTADNGQLPPWKGDYHHDLNTQLSYWPCYSGNRLEDGLSYLDWLWKTRPAAFAWTRRFFGLPGLNVPMTADLNGNQIGGWVQYTHSATTAAWLAHHFYLHWKYSADRQFLQDRAYPYLRDASEFIDAYTAEKDAAAKRRHPLSSSPEIHDNKLEAWFPTITNYDLALNRWLLAAAAELAEELGRGAEARRWRAVLAEMPEFARGGDGRLLVAAGHPLAESHRHLSHLMAIHPLGLIDLADGEQAARTIRATLTDLDRLGTSKWCGYSFAWLASVAARARDGAKAARALEIFATAFVLRNGFHANGDQSGKGYSTLTYRPFTLEGNFAAAAGLQEMLLQSHRGVIEVFPAIPAGWRDAAFETLRAQGAFLVSARRTGGSVEWVEITAERGGACRWRPPWTGRVETLVLKAGERRRFSPDADGRR